MNTNGHSQNGSPSRIVRFPSDVSIGNVALYGPRSTLTPFNLYFGDDDPTKQDSFDDVKEIENIRGELVVPNGTTISLGIYHDSKLPFLATLAPDSLDALYFANSVLADEIPDIGHFTRLRYLGLSKYCGTDHSLNRVSKIRSLTHLLLNRCEEVTDLGFSYLSELSSLSHISCRGTTISGTGLAFLADSPSLHFLDLSDATSLTDDGLANLSKLVSISHLDLSLTGASDRTLSHISKIKSLATLKLACSQITDEGLAYLSGLSSLSYLDLTEAPINGAGFEYLTNLTELSSLMMFGSAITDDSLLHLSQIKSLKHLWLGETAISDNAVRYLSNLTSLKELSLPSFGVSETAIRELRSILPDCHIWN